MRHEHAHFLECVLYVVLSMSNLDLKRKAQTAYFCVINQRLVILKSFLMSLSQTVMLMIVELYC